jgi:hypothetical protein
VKSITLKLENLLEKKLELLGRINRGMCEGIETLSESDLEDLLSIIAKNDEMAQAVKNLDYDIAKIEAAETAAAAILSKRANELLAQIDDIARKNESAYSELIDKLSVLKKQVRSKLDDTLHQERRSGYKPPVNKKAYFIDRLN